MKMPTLPPWTRTIRVRLALTYSGLVFGFATLVLLAVYIAVAQSVDAQGLDAAAKQKFYVSDAGWVKFLDAEAEQDGELVSANDLVVVQQAVNSRTLYTLRTYTLAGLGGLFLVSLLVGWWVAGRVLRPVEVITATAREISATDLSRRIDAQGPQDELHTLADTIDQMLERLHEAFVAQRALVDDVSHELRNPLAVVQANVDAVLSDKDADPEDRRTAALVVSRATADMSRLLDDVLASARQRSGAFEERELTLSTVAEQVVEEYRLLAANREVLMTLRLPDGPTVYADEAALIRAVRNLLSNAVRHSPVGGELTVAVGSREGWAWLAVRDDGPGIPADDQERVFDRFYTTGSTLPAEKSASETSADGQDDDRHHGIGLAITRQIVEAHDGRLNVFSTLDVGSTFVMWLPDRARVAPGERAGTPTDDPLGRR
jgi:signal transduction histidine kinase